MPSSMLAVRRSGISSAAASQAQGATPGQGAVAAIAAPASRAAAMPPSEMPFGLAPRSASQAAAAPETRQLRAAIGRRLPISTGGLLLRQRVGRGRRQRLLLLAPLLEPLQHDEEGGDEDDGQQGRGEHAGEDGDADRP